ncbi:MAG: TraX family protein, partial [Gemmiger sp.]|nr:TraX family protein [Gemmiger sp.]
VWRAVLGVLSPLVCGGAAYLLRTDYNVFGVLAIVVIYLFRKRKTLSVGLACAVLMEVPALVAMLPVHFYNGKRGIQVKWLFYLFYPAHILLLYLVCWALGLGQVPMPF